MKTTSTPQPPLSNRIPIIASIAIFIAAAALSLWAWTRTPPGTLSPVHFNAAGEADRYGGKWEAFGIIPSLLIGMGLLFAFLPKLDPRGEYILRSRRAYHTIWLATMFFFLLLHIALVAVALGASLNISTIMLTAMGLMFLVIGSSLGKIQRNYTMGIRTPWTIDSELVWNKTHRLGGRLFVIAGAICILAVVFLEATIAFIVAMSSLLASTFIAVVYSYWVWRQEKSGAITGSQ
jgi:uncharacterized membrane protein